VRIAFLVDQFPVLSETPYLNQITGMVRRGHEVDVFADYPPASGQWHPDVDRLGLRASTHYAPAAPKSLPGRAAGALHLVATHSGASRRILRRALDPTRVGAHAASFRLPWHAVPFLPGRTYDVVHGCFGPDGIRADRLRRIGAVKGKVVTAFRGADITRYVRSRGEGAYRGLFERGDLFMPVSEDFAARLRAMGADPGRIVVHRTGIDLSLFAYRPRAPERPRRIRLATVARLIEKKGIEYVVRAVGALAREGVDVEYTVIGDGPLREPLRAIAQAEGVEGRVHFVGWKQQRDVRDLLDASDVLVAASVTAKSGDQEGIPNAVKEGMALGLPVVSTRHSGIPELVRDGVTGLLVPERDADALAHAFRTLVAQPSRWATLGRAARDVVEREYDIEKLNDRLVGHYERLLRGDP
jgi:colanic acid/amylovoran biosynthesis glycosyltransferase